MLPTSKMVDVYRQAIESMYDMQCYIITEVDRIDVNTGITSIEHQEEGPYPCRLSFQSSPAGNTDGIAKFSQNTTLFTLPDVIIPKGARIHVLGRSREFYGKLASMAHVYDTHQEVHLDNLEVH